MNPSEIVSAVSDLSKETPLRQNSSSNNNRLESSLESIYDRIKKRQRNGNQESTHGRTKKQRRRILVSNYKLSRRLRTKGCRIKQVFFHSDSPTPFSSGVKQSQSPEPRRPGPENVAPTNIPNPSRKSSKEGVGNVTYQARDVSTSQVVSPRRTRTDPLGGSTSKVVSPRRTRTDPLGRLNCLPSPISPNPSSNPTKTVRRLPPSPPCHHPMLSSYPSIHRRTAIATTSKHPLTRNRTNISHALLDPTIGSKPTVNMEDGGTNSGNSSLADPNYWVPLDRNEIILSSLQIELAWLLEESLYCGRRSAIDWAFVMEHASPELKIELRKMPGFDTVEGNSNSNHNKEEALARLLCPDQIIQAKRFVVVRREIRRKLLQNVVRKRMKTILPRLRKASHPLRQKRMTAKKLPSSLSSSPSGARTTKSSVDAEVILV